MRSISQRDRPEVHDLGDTGWRDPGNWSLRVTPGENLAASGTFGARRTGILDARHLSNSLLNASCASRLSGKRRRASAGAALWLPFRAARGHRPIVSSETRTDVEAIAGARRSEFAVHTAPPRLVAAGFFRRWARARERRIARRFVLNANPRRSNNRCSIMSSARYSIAAFITLDRIGKTRDFRTFLSHPKVRWHQERSKGVTHQKQSSAGMSVEREEGMRNRLAAFAGGRRTYDNGC